MLQGPASILYAQDFSTTLFTGTSALAGTEMALAVRIIPSTTLPQYVYGALTNNNAAPGATLLGALTAVATTAAPAYTTGNLVALSTDLSGNLRTTGTITGTVGVTQSTSPWIVAGGGTAGVPGTAVLTVQGISGGTAIPVSFTGAGTATVAGNLTHNNAAPGANNIGALVAVASAGAPTYTAADQVLLSTDLSGNLRVVGTFAAGALPNATATGTLNALNTTATIAMAGYQGASWFIPSASTLIGTVTPEVSFDNTTWFPTYFYNSTVTGVTYTATVTTSSGTAYSAGIVIPPGATNVRVRVSAFTSGTATATITTTAVDGVDIPYNIGIAGQAAVQAGVVAGVDGSGNIQFMHAQGNNTAAPATGMQPVLIGRYDTALPTLSNGNVAAWELDVNGRGIVVGAGTAGTPAGGVVSIQGVTSGTAVIVNNATAANLNAAVVGTLTNNTAAPAANNVGVLAALVTAGAQAWTAGNQVLLTTDTSGYLKVNLVANSFGTLTVSGTVTANQGGAPWTQTGTLTSNNAAPGANNLGVLSAVAYTPGTAPTYTTGNMVVPTTDLKGNLNVNVVNGGANSATGTLTQVAYTTSSTTILAANASRKGAIIYNNANRTLYVGLTSSAVSAAAFTTALVASGGYWEVPFGYTGQINGIWAAGGSGNAQVTENT